MPCYHEEMRHRIFANIPVAVFGLLGIFLPLLYTTNTDELFEFPKMLFVYGAGSILLLYWMIKSLRNRKVLITQTPFDIPILLFVFSQLLSTLFSIDMHTSLYGYYSRFNGGLFSTLSYVFLFYAGVTLLSQEAVKKVVLFFFIGGVLASLYAFPEHFGVSPSCILLTGEFTASCWVQDVQSRVFGTFGQPNWLGAYLVVLLPLTASYIFMRQKSETRTQKYSILHTVAFLLFTSVLVFTKSRSGIAGASIALLLQVFFASLFAVKDTVLKKTVFSLQQFVNDLRLPLGMFLLFTALVFFIPNPVGQKLQNMIPSQRISQDVSVETQQPVSGTQLESGGSESGDIRKVVWKGAIGVWKRYPLFGSGVETFAYSYFQDRPSEHNFLSEWDFLYNKAHNEFVNYFSTTGIVGLISYVIMLGSFIIFPVLWGIRKNALPHGSRSLLLGISASLIGLSVSNFFGFSTVVVSLLTFLLPAWGYRIYNEHLEEKRKHIAVSIPKFFHLEGEIFTKKSLLKTAKLIVLLLFFSLPLRHVVNQYRADTYHAKAKTLLSAGDLENSLYSSIQAVATLPNEPTFRDDLSFTAGRIAVALSESGMSTDAATMTAYAIEQSEHTLNQNAVHINFYKTRIRLFLLLAQMDPMYYEDARTTIEKARTLSPTDAKLVYTLALVDQAQNDVSSYEKHLKETLALRPIDEPALMALGQLYELQEKRDFAKETYEKVLQLYPNNTVAKDRLASVSATQK